MAVFVFYRIPLDFLQKEWMYRGCHAADYVSRSLLFAGAGISIPSCFDAGGVAGLFRTFVPELEMRFPAFRSERQPVGSVSDTANPNADAFGFAVSDVAIYLYTTSAASGFSKACKSWSCPSLI